MYDPSTDHGMPLGFGMALAQNPSAMQAFSSLSPEQQHEVINATHQIHSKQEMSAYINQLGK
jgi:uncharacterized protein YdeI (YjbR/CyaY-like superfamily)